VSLRAGDVLKSRGRWLGGGLVTPVVERPTQPAFIGRNVSFAPVPDPILLSRPWAGPLRELEEAGRQMEEQKRGV